MDFLLRTGNAKYRPEFSVSPEIGTGMQNRRDCMENAFSRTEILLGQEAVARLSRARVAVFGIGGVGGYVCEALVRSGIGAFDLIDKDRVSLTNLNRQIIATQKTIGLYKTDVMKDRILEINPEAAVRVYRTFALPDNMDSFPFESFDYVVDAVDTVTAKLALAEQADKYHIPMISCMGAGNKLDGSLFRVADIYETKVCPLARIMRKELKRRGITGLKVVYSEEPPLPGLEPPSEPSAEADSPNADVLPGNSGRRAVPGSVAFVPSAAGLLIAGEVVKDLLHTDGLFPPSAGVSPNSP